MEMLRTISFTACVLGIVFSLISNGCPSEKFSKQLSVIFSLIFILVIAKGITGIDLSADTLTAEDYYAEYDEAYGERIDELLSGEIESNLCGSLEELLAEKKIFPAKIFVTVNNSGGDSISIINAGAELEYSDRGKTDYAAALIADALGIDKSCVEITVSSKEEEQ
ncbi:MAG: hypothetical protein ACI4JJ_00925 [Huintestinicola sp.]